MTNNLKPSKKFIFLGILIIALGITISTTLKETINTLGTVLIAVGGLFFVIGMSKKRKEEEQKNK